MAVDLWAVPQIAMAQSTFALSHAQTHSESPTYINPPVFSPFCIDPSETLDGFQTWFAEYSLKIRVFRYADADTRIKLHILLYSCIPFQIRFDHFFNQRLERNGRFPFQLFVCFGCIALQNINFGGTVQFFINDEIITIV